MFEVKFNEHKCKVFQTNHKKEQKKLMIFEDLCQEEQKALVTTEMTFSFSRYIAKIPLQKGRSDKQNYSKHTSRLLWDKILVLIVD